MFRFTKHSKKQRKNPSFSHQPESTNTDIQVQPSIKLKTIENINNKQGMQQLGKKREELATPRGTNPKKLSLSLWLDLSLPHLIFPFSNNTRPYSVHTLFTILHQTCVAERKTINDFDG